MTVAANGEGAGAQAGPAAWPRVGTYVEAYEAAWARHGDADPADHAAPAGHPERLAVLCELVRVDLEYRWGRGEHRRLDHYRGRFPELFADPALVRAVAFEEFRLRDQAGHSPDPAEYRDRYGLDGLNAGGPAAVMEAAASAYLAYRRDGGQSPPALDRLLDSYHVPRDHGELLRQIDRDDPHAAERLAEAIAGLPRVGSSFLGFRLCRELGRGAFGRVFLARQGDLADRLVALKVSADVVSETHALAQLQHTNVVPVYSVHRRGPYQAVCMPYLGATTLADSLAAIRRQPTLPGSGAGLLSTLRGRAGDGGPPPEAADAAPDAAASAPPASTPQLERLRELSYVPAVLWLVARLADGLAHAHERGILHRDLKPANILFADDGEPLLLDFSLAADLKAPARAGVALVGGTLPYMAPEQLRSFRDDRSLFEARSDVYSLGVILYELLTGVSPFPAHRGSVDEVLPRMIADREAGAPDVRRANASVSPAVAAVVRHCLEPDPARRYRSARALQEDLTRQLENRPLKHTPEPSLFERMSKWSRRHPGLTSSTTVALAAGVLLAAATLGAAAWHRKYQAVAAADAYRELGNDRAQALALLTMPADDPSLADEGIALCRRGVGRFGVTDDTAWLGRAPAAALPAGDRDRLRRDVGELLVLWARALLRRPGAEAAAGAAPLLDRAEACYGASPVPRALVEARAELARRGGKGPAEVGRLRVLAASTPPASLRERLLLDPGQVDPSTRKALADEVDAAAADGLQDSAVWVALGNWNVRFGRAEAALAAYNVAVAMAPRLDWPRYNRAALYLERGEPARALADLDRVIAAHPGLPGALLNRAVARLGLGDARGAADDLTRCLATDGAPTRAWFMRARVRDRLGDGPGAESDRAEGLRRNPSDASSYVARGLARLPADPQGALADFDAALALDPRHRDALQDRASLLSETLGRPEEAVAVLDVAVREHPGSVEALGGRGVLLARLGRRDEAVRDARAAVAIDARPLALYQAACVFALTSKREPADRDEALQLLARAARDDPTWLRVAPTDPDLAPLHDRPEFRELLRSLTVVHRQAGERPAGP